MIVADKQGSGAYTVTSKLCQIGVALNRSEPFMIMNEWTPTSATADGVIFKSLLISSWFFQSSGLIICSIVGREIAYAPLAPVTLWEFFHKKHFGATTFEEWRCENQLMKLPDRDQACYGESHQTLAHIPQSWWSWWLLPEVKGCILVDLVIYSPIDGAPENPSSLRCNIMI